MARVIILVTSFVQLIGPQFGFYFLGFTIQFSRLGFSTFRLVKNKNSHLTIVVGAALCWTLGRGGGGSVGLAAVADAHTVYLNHKLLDQVLKQ